MIEFIVERNNVIVREDYDTCRTRYIRLIQEMFILNNTEGAIQLQEEFQMKKTEYGVV